MPASRAGVARGTNARVTRFSHYELRATDVEMARRFYSTLLGHDRASIVQLPPEVAARGAPPHWLGMLGVADVESTASAFVERGAMRLGPTRDRDGGEVAILRDPGGAVVALSTSSPIGGADVVWHVLNALALERTSAAYRDLFGWAAVGSRQLGDLGVLHDFAWRTGEPAAGSFTDITGRAGRHPHWLFHFGTEDIERSSAIVREAGGLVLGPFELPDGSRVAVCDDPQGAAFALHGAI
jgi:predicted enzyme related to lactoylglutathione lyase